jgi:hypothetical protein
VVVVVVVVERWGYWGRESSESDDPVGNYDGEARGEDAFSLWTAV